MCDNIKYNELYARFVKIHILQCFFVHNKKFRILDLTYSIWDFFSTYELISSIPIVYIFVRVPRKKFSQCIYNHFQVIFCCLKFILNIFIFTYCSLFTYIFLFKLFFDLNPSNLTLMRYFIIKYQIYKKYHVINLPWSRRRSKKRNQDK